MKTIITHTDIRTYTCTRAHIRTYTRNNAGENSFTHSTQSNFYITHIVNYINMSAVQKMTFILYKKYFLSREYILLVDAFILMYSKLDRKLFIITSDY